MTSMSGFRNGDRWATQHSIFCAIWLNLPCYVTAWRRKYWI